MIAELLNDDIEDKKDDFKMITDEFSTSSVRRNSNSRPSNGHSRRNSQIENEGNTTPLIDERINQPPVRTRFESSSSENIPVKVGLITIVGCGTI